MKSYFEWTDSVPTGDRIIHIRLDKAEMANAQLTDFDRLLLQDINKGEKSDTPIADQILGLEVLVRKMEEAAKVTQTPETIVGGSDE